MDNWIHGGNEMTAKVAVILFPGVNCEEETKFALESSGINADIVRWNSVKGLEKYDGYVLPGGWSYEDRIRAGVISAQDPIMSIIKQQVKNKKPVLGICNGAQVLIESGMIPGLKDEVQMALAPNINPFISGFYCTWSYVKTNKNPKCAFTKLYHKDEVIAVPIAHGEGRFTTIEKDLLDILIEHNQIIFRYCDKNGNVENNFPINPNGSLYNIAGIRNKEGNVMAMMPHPERASFMRQSPFVKGNAFEETESPLAPRKIFESMKIYIEENTK
jgi:phosphoribosylformylglycinamidine synthase subunit PurQ / glutaminase